MIPIDYYSVYRGVPNGTFDCIHSSTTPDWSGDTNEPVPGELFAYLVTATETGTESGAGDDRTLGAACSAP